MKFPAFLGEVNPKSIYDALWIRLWKMIPEPETNGRLLVAPDDFINPKTGRNIFGCANIFDHAAKQNQTKYPRAQNVVSIGLLKMIKGRWACLPLKHCYYNLKKDIKENCPKYNGKDSVVEYFQLTHNERHPVTRKPVAKIIHNFGRTDSTH